MIYNILFIEDNDSDFEMAKRAFRTQNLKTKNKMAVKITRQKDGSESMEMVQKINQGTITLKDLPHLIFLDLDIPIYSGKDLLQEFRKCPPLKRVPLIIFSGTQNENDIIESYEKGANSFMKKSLNFQDWIYQFDLLRNYWLEAVVIPPHSP